MAWHASNTIGILCCLARLIISEIGFTVPITFDTYTIDIIFVLLLISSCNESISNSPFVSIGMIFKIHPFFSQSNCHGNILA